MRGSWSRRFPAAVPAVLVVLAVAGAPAELRAQTNYCSAGGLAAGISDDAYTGALTSPSMTVVNVPISDSFTVTDVDVRISMAHTWIGDLVIKVIAPDNTVVTLMSRPGVVETADDGAAVGGDSSNLAVAFPITWSDGAAASAESMGNTLANTQVVCQNDLICTFDPNKGAASGGKLAAFVGKTSAGTWRVAIGDGALGDIGSIDRVCLILSPGPPAGSVPDRQSLGAPLIVRKNGGAPANLDLTWGDSCGAGQDDFAVYEGTLGTWYGHAPKSSCTTAGGFSLSNLAPSGSDAYYLVVPLKTVSAGIWVEGSYGKDSASAEIPRLAGACNGSQVLPTCP